MLPMCQTEQSTQQPMKHHFPYLENEPSLKTMGTFGCLCYIKNMTTKHKFAPNAEAGILLGYRDLGYIFLLLKNESIQHWRDVVFDIDVFPFQDTTATFGENNIENEFDFELNTDISPTEENQPAQINEGIQEEEEEPTPISGGREFLKTIEETKNSNH